MDHLISPTATAPFMQLLEEQPSNVAAQACRCRYSGPAHHDYLLAGFVRNMPAGTIWVELELGRNFT